MSILPSNESKHLHTLDEQLASRWEFDITKNPLNPRWCEAKYMPFIAKAYDIDISLFTEAEARAVLETAIFSKNKIGTLRAVKRVVEVFDADARIETGATVPRYNGTYKYDGTITYKDYKVDHWAKYTIVLSKAISISQEEKLIRVLELVAPARCELVGIDAQITIIYDGSNTYDGNYNYGGYING